MLTLRELKPGQKARVVALRCTGPLKQRLLGMGFTPGTELFVRKAAPLGDPVEITVRGYELSLRKADIETIEVESL
jgi:ferrous iron transport protein A